MWWGKYLGKLLGSLGGGHGVIPNTIRIFGKIPKYCVESRQHTNNSFMTGHAYFKLYPARMFIYLKHLCTSNQPKPLRGNVCEKTSNSSVQQ